MNKITITSVLIVSLVISLIFLVVRMNTVSAELAIKYKQEKKEFFDTCIKDGKSEFDCKLLVKETYWL